ncbi:hypothetical protein MKEN_00151900 [Mycena kentingensis (nom. inval.)]|nr:hypothetical protein MKEN_00151900 [Mycena kentingensis (nom. inval.)]
MTSQRGRRHVRVSPPIWLRQLKRLGKSREKLFPGTVVVRGGSVAGILSARPDIKSPGKRIVQWSAAHIYLCLFITGARRLWSNFDEVAKSFGGRYARLISLDQYHLTYFWYSTLPADLQIHFSGVEILGPEAKYPNGDFPDTLLLRRTGVKKTMHRLLLQTQATSRSGVSVVSGTVRGFHAAPDKSAVESVTIRRTDGTLETVQDAALLIDCTGKSQAGFKWLQSATYPVPDKTKPFYDPNLRYQTCTFTVTGLSL